MGILDFLLAPTGAAEPMTHDDRIAAVAAALDEARQAARDAAEAATQAARDALRGGAPEQEDDAIRAQLRAEARVRALVVELADARRHAHLAKVDGLREELQREEKSLAKSERERDRRLDSLADAIAAALEAHALAFGASPLVDQTTGKAKTVSPEGWSYSRAAAIAAVMADISPSIGVDRFNSIIVPRLATVDAPTSAKIKAYTAKTAELRAAIEQETSNGRDA